MPEEIIEEQIVVPDAMAGSRLDRVAAELFPDYSRVRLQDWIRAGELTVDGRVLRPREKLLGREMLRLRTRQESRAEGDWTAEQLGLDILYEDEDLLIINKPAGLVVHPAAGNRSGTLLNGLLHHDPSLERLPRAGIIHRLDKDTTGLMVVARSLRAHTALVRQLQDRSVRRQYMAVVCGVPTGGGCVDAPLGRHPVNRKKQAVVDTGKPAVTHYRLLERYRHHSLLQVRLETGRTHQIRVHMAHIRYPLVGDPVYGRRLALPPGATDGLVEQLKIFPRQALHAGLLGLRHPADGRRCEWEVDVPEDMQNLLRALREDADVA
ncbi:MAG: 23S rRNA pseudouridine(1911/1915/1917) synthase RluD [Pseudohongiellaceae bacterium]